MKKMKLSFGEECTYKQALNKVAKINVMNHSVVYDYTNGLRLDLSKNKGFYAGHPVQLFLIPARWNHDLHYRMPKCQIFVE